MQDISEPFSPNFPEYNLRFYPFSCYMIVHSKTGLFQICIAVQGCPQGLWLAYPSIPQSFCQRSEDTGQIAAPKLEIQKENAENHITKAETRE